MSFIPLNTESPSEALADLLFAVKIKDVMTSPVITVTPDMPMSDIQNIMRTHHFTGMPVVSNGRMIGIVSMSNLVSALDDDASAMPCSRYLTRNVIALREDMSVSFAVSYFNKYKFRRFPVVDSSGYVTGIVTPYDVMASLLSAVNAEMERLESESPHIPVDDSSAQSAEVIEFTTEPFNFERAGQASTAIKKMLKSHHIDDDISRRVSIASYELEINQVVHSDGGVMRYVFDGTMLTIEAVDSGPGIPDVDKAMTEGFSTAGDKVRSLGFGAGMGLPNTKRVSDTFSITSSVPSGTDVRVSFCLVPRSK